MDLANIFRDVGVSGRTSTSSRSGFKALAARLRVGDVVMVAALDRIGRRWLETINALANLRRREVRVKSLSPSEEWAVSLAADPNGPEGFVAHLLVDCLAWVGQQESEAISRRTLAGLDRAKAQGERLGRPPALTPAQVDALCRLHAEGRSIRRLAKDFNVAPTTITRALASASRDCI